MGLLIENRQTKLLLPLDKIEQTGQAILNALGCPNAELSILIVDDFQIKALNKKYLGRHRPTNVIAFPMREGNFSDISPSLLGDVVISIETAKKEAEVADISTTERLVQLLVHGVLHLFGYDHSGGLQASQEMEKRSEELLKLID